MEQFDLKRAKEIAEKVHQDQVDKAGVEYIKHPLAVANLLESDDGKLVAILHDVVEDSDMTFEDLANAGCPSNILAALRLVTHDKDYDGSEEAYFEKILKIASSGNQLAIDVKFADLTHNSDRTRIENPTEKDEKRWEKYRVSKEILRPHVSEYLREL